MIGPRSLKVCFQTFTSLYFTKITLLAPVRKQDSDGNWVSDSDGDSDPYCWWSSTNCVKPKAKYLPADVYTCPTNGDWGLTYDDGPFNRYDADEDEAELENKYAEPALYNFLAKTKNQKATLFVSCID